MFEREAESYATQECCVTCNNINHFCKEKCECWTFTKKGVEFGYIKGSKQLTKAKEIIKDYMTIVKGNHTTVCGVSEENRTIDVLKLNEEADKFLREVQ